MTASTPRGRRTTALVATAIAALLAGLGLGWAGHTLLAAPDALPAATNHVAVRAKQGTVQRSIQLNAKAAWSGGAVILNQSQGTVTRVRLTRATTIRSGDALYDVDLRPVRVAQGSVPSFRALALGARGEDVRQLQSLLTDQGFRSGRPDGVFGAATEGQVKAWQRAADREPIGRVPLGELLFVPRLPATLALGSGIAVGRTVSPGGGTDGATSDNQATQSMDAPGAVRVLPPAPRFSISLPENQARVVQKGMAVELTREGATWWAVVHEISIPGRDGSSLATLAPRGKDTAICAKACDTIPANGDAAIQARILLVPPASGVTVPAAALVVGADGAAAVVTEGGETKRVTVKAAAGGQVVVEGINAGEMIRVPGR